MKLKNNEIESLNIAIAELKIMNHYNNGISYSDKLEYEKNKELIESMEVLMFYRAKNKNIFSTLLNKLSKNNKISIKFKITFFRILFIISLIMLFIWVTTNSDIVGIIAFAIYVIALIANIGYACGYDD